MISKTSAKYAQLFVSETCPSSWYRFTSLRPWSPNEKDCGSAVICKWRGPCIPTEMFFSVLQLLLYVLHGTSFTILVCDSNNEKKTSIFHVSGAYSPPRSFLKSHSYPLHSRLSLSTKPCCTVKHFTAQGDSGGIMDTTWVAINRNRHISIRFTHYRTWETFQSKTQRSIQLKEES